MASPFIFPNSFCRNVSDCFPCNDIPTTNTSSESPDVFQDYSIQWGNLQTNTPPLGKLFTSNGCVTISAATTPEEAFLLSQQSQALCIINKWQPEPPDPPVCLSFPCAPPPTPPPDPPVQDFGNDPESCNSLCADGTPFTFTVPPGSFIATNQILADRMARSFACREAILHKVCLNLVSNICCMGEESTLTFVSTGPPLDAVNNLWQITSGSLPPGFSFGPTNAGPILNITGTPTALGDFTFTMRVTAPTGDFMDRQFTVTVAGITNADPLPDGQTGTAYSTTLTASGIDNTTWVVFDGVLPDGLTLDLGTGEISGTPTVGAEFEFTIEASNEDVGCLKVFHITVAGCFIDEISPLTTPFVTFGDGTFRYAGTYPDPNMWGGSTAGTNLPMFYLNRVVELLDNVASIHPGQTGAINALNQSNGIVAGTQGNDVFWVDLFSLVTKNLGPAGGFGGLGSPIKVLNNGKILMQQFAGGQAAEAAIYDPGTDTLFTHLVVPFSFENPVYDWNNSEVMAGARDAPFGVRRAATMVKSGANLVHTYVPLPGDAGAAVASNVFRIRDNGHMLGFWNDGINLDNVFFVGSATVTLFDQTFQEPEFPQCFLNDNDVVAVQIVDFNTGFRVAAYWTLGGGNTFVGVGPFDTTVAGLNNSGVMTGTTNGAAYVYTPAMGLKLLTSLISPTTGWTTFDVVYQISDDNIVFGQGTLNGNPAQFAAKLCI